MRGVAVFTRFDIVFCLRNGKYGLIVTVSDNEEDEFPLEVVFEDGTKEFYTKAGKLYHDDTIVLKKIRLKDGKYIHPTPKARDYTKLHQNQGRKPRSGNTESRKSTDENK